MYACWEGEVRHPEPKKEIPMNDHLTGFVAATLNSLAKAPPAIGQAKL